MLAVILQPGTTMIQLIPQTTNHLITSLLYAKLLRGS